MNTNDYKLKVEPAIKKDIDLQRVAQLLIELAMEQTQWQRATESVDEEPRAA